MLIIVRLSARTLRLLGPSLDFLSLVVATWCWVLQVADGSLLGSFRFLGNVVKGYEVRLYLGWSLTHAAQVVVASISCTHLMLPAGCIHSGCPRFGCFPVAGRLWGQFPVYTFGW